MNMHSSKRSKSNEHVWIAIRSIKGGKYKIAEGDLLRLGRIVYGVRRAGEEPVYSDKHEPIYASNMKEGGGNT